MKKIILLIMALGGWIVRAAEIPVNPAQFDDLQGKVHRGNLGRTGVFNATGVSNAPAQRWKFQTGGAIKSSPVVVDGVVYFGSHDGAVYAVNAASGALIWSNQTGGKVSGSAAVVSNTVFIASENGRLYALNAATGETRWSVLMESGRVPAGSPAVAYGTVIMAAGSQYGHRAVSMTSGSIYAYDMQTGAQIWESFSTGPQGLCALALDATNLYAAVGASASYGAFCISNGSTLWSQGLGHQNRQYGSATVKDNKVYFPGALRGSVSRHSSGSRTTDWMNTTWQQNLDMQMNSGGLFGYEILGDLALAHGHLYAGCNDGKLHTFDQTSGVRGWTFQTGGRVRSSPSVASGIVYFGSDNGKVYAVNATNGTEIWNYDLGAAVISSPWPADGTLTVGCDDGAVYCLEEGEPLADMDNDGLPDDWESQYFGGATNANAAATASNGINTVLECYIAGISPVDPSAAFLISDLRPLTSKNVLWWNVTSGRVYTVYWSSNLLSGFQMLHSNYTGGVFTDAVHGADDQGFYRIEVQL